MKTHSTNYFNTFIQVAEDCPAQRSEAPPEKEPKAAARRAYEMIAFAPYRHASDDALYETQARPKGISREAFFLKGQPCLRASALTQRYGWGVHCDGEGRMALYGIETEDYRRLRVDGSLQQVKAMRTRKK